MPLVTKTFSDIITFTRNSGATYFDSNGVLQTAGNNVPRLDYNPITLAAQGLLIEEARTNFFTNASGSALGTIGTGTVIGPDNVLCRTFIPTAGVTSFPNITGPVQTFTLSLGQTVDWAISGWFAAGPVGSFALEPRLVFNVSVNNATSFIYAELQINTSSWTVRQKALGIGLTEVSAPTITLFKPGLYRVTWVVRYTQDATGRNNVTASVQARDTASSGTYTADGVSGFQYTLVQAETGSFVTSTIPTTTTALTRNADEASVNTLSPWFNATAGTIYTEFVIGSTSPTTGFPTAAAFSNGTVNNRIVAAYLTNSTDSLDYFVSDGGATQAGLITGAYSAGTVAKMASAYAVNDFAVCRGGGAVGTDTSGTVPVINVFHLGHQISSNYLGGYLRRITYYPRRLSNAELVSITS